MYAYIYIYIYIYILISRCCRPPQDKDKVVPCVELTNLWTYDPSQPISYWMQLQERSGTNTKRRSNDIYSWAPAAERHILYYSIW